jgi:protein-tyrosine phosphatase
MDAGLAKIKKNCQELNKSAKQQGSNITIYPGAEVAIAMDALDIIKGPGDYCINGGRYILIELPAFEIPGFVDDFLFTLQVRGLTPIIAHPERHPNIAKDPEILVPWINKGILLQVNSSSIVGLMGERVKKTARKLIFNRMVHCIGSDAHSTRTRKPNLGICEDMLLELTDRRFVNQILYENPASIIESREVIVSGVGRVSQTPGRLRRLLTKIRSN